MGNRMAGKKRTGKIRYHVKKRRWYKFPLNSKVVGSKTQKPWFNRETRAQKKYRQYVKSRKGAWKFPLRHRSWGVKPWIKLWQKAGSAAKKNLHLKRHRNQQLFHSQPHLAQWAGDWRNKIKLSEIQLGVKYTPTKIKNTKDCARPGTKRVEFRENTNVHWGLPAYKFHKKPINL